jgi:hypothetical protein
LSGCSSQTTTGEVAALSLQLAGALTDRELSDQLLARAVESALKLLDGRAV